MATAQAYSFATEKTALTFTYSDITRAKTVTFSAMFSSAAFVLAPVRSWPPARRSSQSRCAVVRCTVGSPTSNDSGGAADWLEMARSFSNGSADSDPPRPPPVWKYPEGKNFSTPEPPSVGKDGESGDVEGRHANPWAVWSKALGDKPFSKKEDPSRRDPREETDFWKDAAKDLAANSAKTDGSEPDVSQQNSRLSTGSVAMPAGSDYADPEVPSDRHGLWSAASQVTNSIVGMQERLRDELQSYNPVEEGNAYRDMARELAGPEGPRSSEETTDIEYSDFSSVERIRSNQGHVSKQDLQGGANAGTGWNPDVDWMRYDDVGREAQKESDVAHRAEARKDAERKRRAAVEKMNMFEYSPPGQTSFTYTDVDGRILSEEEVTTAIVDGAILVDENGTELSSPERPALDNASNPSPISYFETSSPSVTRPGGKFGRDGSLRYSSTYGPGAAGIDREIERLQRDGVRLRDSEADKDYWRNAARDLTQGLTSPESDSQDRNEEAPQRHAQSPLEQAPTDTSIGQAVISGIDGESPISPSSLDHPRSHEPEKSGDTFSKAAPLSDPEIMSGSSEGASAWATWQTGQKSWQRAVETAAPRDPKAEVDRWRETARSYVPSTEFDKKDEVNTSANSQHATNGDASATSDDSDPWDAWNAANDSWQQELGRADNVSADGNMDKWIESAKGMGAASDPGVHQHRRTASNTTDHISEDNTGFSEGGGTPWSTWHTNKSPQAAPSWGGSAAWWSSRSDVPRRNSTKNVGSNESGDSGAARWQSAARDMLSGSDSFNPILEKKSPSPERQSSIGDEINFWKRFAKDVSSLNEKPSADSSGSTGKEE